LPKLLSGFGEVKEIKLVPEGWEKRARMAGHPLASGTRTIGRIEGVARWCPVLAQRAVWEGPRCTYAVGNQTGHPLEMDKIPISRATASALPTLEKKRSGVLGESAEEDANGRASACARPANIMLMTVSW